MLTCAAAPVERRKALEGVAEVLLVSEEAVDVTRAVAALHERGLTKVLTEGGPSLLGDFFGADLVDELLFVLSPMVVGGGLPLSTGGHAPLSMRLHAAHQGDDHRFLQYRRA